MLVAESIAHALGARRKYGKRWMVQCPAHEDRTPSCSIGEDSRGKILVHCFSGCRQEDVIQALRSRGLWPETAKAKWTAAEKQDWGKRRRSAERLAENAQLWLRAYRCDLESKKQHAYQMVEAVDSRWFFTWVDASRELHLLESFSPPALLQSFTEACSNNKRLARQYVARGRRMDFEALKVTSVVVALLAASEGVYGAA